MFGKIGLYIVIKNGTQNVVKLKHNLNFNLSIKEVNFFFLLQTTCLSAKDVNYVKFLQEIATEHQFEVTFVDIEERTFSGRHQCLVQLSTFPVAVCPGSGVNSTDAQSDAAHNALEYLKIMTKK